MKKILCYKGRVLSLLFLLIMMLTGITVASELQNKFVYSLPEEKNLSKSLTLVTVPYLIGTDIYSAYEELQLLGFYNIYLFYDYSDSVPYGIVMDQTPIAGSLVWEEDDIYLLVSLGPYSYEGEGYIEGIPEGVVEGFVEGMLEGIPEGIIEGLFEGEGVAEGVTEGVTEGIQEGEGVIEGLFEGEGIVEGEVPVEMPNVIGMNVYDTKILLENTLPNFYIYINYECDETTPTWEVKNQWPAGGEMYYSNETIYLTVSAGACLDMMYVPNVVGMREYEALNYIWFNGLNVYLYYLCSDEVPYDKVIQQEPVGNSYLQIGDTVKIGISIGSQCVVVPNIVGKDKRDAINELQSLNLSIDVDNIIYECSDYPANQVIYQSVEPGENVPFDTYIYIKVSSGPCETIGIDSIEKLQKIGNDPAYPINGNYVLTSDIDATDTVNWNEGRGFKPIGNVDNPFTGTFDGQYHVIHGLYIDTSQSYNYAGLFAVIGEGGIAENLILVEAFVRGYYSIGAIAGELWTGGKIRRCASVYSYVESTDAMDWIGGLVGGSGGIINECYSSSMVISYDAEWGTGGLVGYNVGEVENSWTDFLVSGTYYVGGLIGKQIDGKVENCWSNASVWGELFSGALIGYKEAGDVISCYYIDNTGTRFSDGGTGITEEQLYQQSTFVGWDFDNVWIMNPYPDLRWKQSVQGEGEGTAEGEGEVLVSIPNVVGQSEDQAKTTLQNQGLSNIQIVYQCNNAVAKGNVISQIPNADTQVTSQAFIQLTVSNGPCVSTGVIVPDVVGRTEQQATEVIQTAELTLKVEREYDNYIPEGSVIRQSPVAGSGVNKGSEVTIWVSKGPSSEVTYVTVPNVIGQDVNSAITQLQSAGLKEQRTLQYSDTVPQNTVMGQSPVGGSSVLSGTTVEILVSAGPDPAGSKLSQPRGLQAFPGVDHVYLVWEANTEWDLTGYRLERSDNKNGPWTAVANGITTTNYKDNTVDTTRAWYYRLIALGTGGKESAPSEVVKAEPGKLVVWIPEIDWLLEDPNEEIRVPVNISSARGLEPYTIDIKIIYDNNALELIKVVSTVVSRNLEVLVNKRENSNTIEFHAGPRQDNEQKVLYGEGRLFDIVFKSKLNIAQGECAKTVDLKIDKAIIKDSELKLIPIERKDGKISILETNPDEQCITEHCLFGDIDPDGYVGMADAVLLLRKIVRKSSISNLDCDLRRGDFNGDGLLDCADASLLLRRLSGLPINPSEMGGGKAKALLATDTQRTVKVIGTNKPDENGEYKVGIELDSLVGFAGMDMILTFDAGISFSSLKLEDVISEAQGYKKETEIGDGYLKVSISGQKEVQTKSSDRIIQISFKSTLPPTESKDIKLQIRDVKIKGQFGDDLSWYGDIKTEDGLIKIVGVTPQEGEGPKEGQEEGAVEGQKEGTSEGAKEGITEGQKEGTSEGAKEGSTQQGTNEGSTEGTTTNQPQDQSQSGGCGCGKSLDRNAWWKYLLDFIFIGILTIFVSGMKKQRKSG